LEIKMRIQLLALFILMGCIFSGCVVRRIQFEKNIALADNEYQGIVIEFLKPIDAQELIALGNGKEYQYWFSDSSAFYVTTELSSNTLNYSQLKYVANESDFNEIPYPSMSMSDTIIQLGHDKDELIWKEVGIYQGQLRYGYLNVSSERKDEFDEYLNNVKSTFIGKKELKK